MKLVAMLEYLNALKLKASCAREDETSKTQPAQRASEGILNKFAAS
jgi:hypothetical protein